MGTCDVAPQIDAGTIFHYHFLDYVVSFGEMSLSLIRCRPRDSFDQWAYADIAKIRINALEWYGDITHDVILELSGDATQQAGLHHMAEELDYPAVNGIVSVSCANHAHSLVFQAEISENRVLQHGLAATRKVQRIIRSRWPARLCGRMCPNCPDRNWCHLSAILRSIVDEARKGDPMAFLMQCNDIRNPVGIAMRAIWRNGFQ
jgi:hypothetical protein